MIVVERGNWHAKRRGANNNKIVGGKGNSPQKNTRAKSCAADNSCRERGSIGWVIGELRLHLVSQKQTDAIQGSVTIKLKGSQPRVTAPIDGQRILLENELM